MIDAKHIEQHLDEEKPEGAENEAEEQVAFADRMILNKTDLVTEVDIARVEKRLRSINAFAPIMHSCQSNVSVDSVLNIHGFDVNKVLEMDPEFLNTDGEHVHDASVTSCSIVMPGEVHMALVNEWISAILRDKGADIYRMKGVLAIANAPQKFVYQAVHMIFDGKFDEPWQPGEPRESKLVFIGKNIKPAELRADFAACLDSPENSAKILALEQVKANEQLGKQLMGAAQRDDSPMLTSILQQGVDVNHTNPLGQTAMHISAMWGRTMSLSLLIKAGADLNKKNSSQIGAGTPLHMAAAGRGDAARRAEGAQMLVEAGADRTITNDAGAMAWQMVTPEDAAEAPQLVAALKP